jgi:NAD(P)-dependent dehydrogenase (short-subunit alcohol dehydrogenase family)
MKYVIVITGASSGFGALTARALAKAGHTVYASIGPCARRAAAPNRPRRRAGDTRLHRPGGIRPPSERRENARIPVRQG